MYCKDCEWFIRDDESRALYLDEIGVCIWHYDIEKTAVPCRNTRFRNPVKETDSNCPVFLKRGSYNESN